MATYSHLSGSTVLYQYAEDAAVPTTTDTTVLTYTVPASTVAYIQGIVGTGSSTQRYKLKVAGTDKLVARTSAATPTTHPLLGDGAIVATAGQAVTIVAYHDETTNQVAQVALFGYTRSV